MSCTRFHADDESGLTCDAFPEGIPDDIIYNDFDHRSPHADDNGLQYDPTAPGEPNPDPFADDQEDDGQPTP
jgi:hypothetical protein